MAADESLNEKLGTAVGAIGLAPWENSVLHMDTVQEYVVIFDDCARRRGFGS